MKHLDWCKNVLKDNDAQKLLEEKVEALIEQHFKDKEDYPIEKFIKSFSETFIYLESLMLMQRGIHPSQIEKNMIYISTHKEETLKKYEEVKKTLIAEINRQYRHFGTFLRC